MVILFPIVCAYSSVVTTLIHVHVCTRTKIRTQVPNVHSRSGAQTFPNFLCYCRLWVCCEVLWNNLRYFVLHVNVTPWLTVLLPPCNITPKQFALVTLPLASLPKLEVVSPQYLPVHHLNWLTSITIVIFFNKNFHDTKTNFHNVKTVLYTDNDGNLFRSCGIKEKTWN